MIEMNPVIILAIVFGIFGLWIFHKTFKVFFTSFTQLIISEFAGAMLFGVLMAVLVTKKPLLSIVIVALIGCILTFTSNTGFHRGVSIVSTVAVIVLIYFSSKYLASQTIVDEKVKEMVGVYFRDNDLSGDVIGIDDYSGVMVAENFITNVNKSEEQLDEENIVVVQMEISNIKNNRVYAEDDKGNNVEFVYDESNKTITVEKITLIEGDSLRFKGVYTFREISENELSPTSYENKEDNSEQDSDERVEEYLEQERDNNAEENSEQQDFTDQNIGQSESIVSAENNYNELIESIVNYYVIEYGTNNVAGELDYETEDVLTFRLYDPYATTTSNTLGYYEYYLKTGEWKDAITGDVIILDNTDTANSESFLNDNNSFDDYILPYSDEVLLTEADLENLSPQELSYARNEIYARHGYIFKSNELNNYFMSRTWYTPDVNFDGILYGIELENANFIREYQNAHDKNYKLDS